MFNIHQPVSVDVQYILRKLQFFHLNTVISFCSLHQLFSSHIVYQINLQRRARDSFSFTQVRKTQDLDIQVQLYSTKLLLEYNEISQNSFFAKPCCVYFHIYRKLTSTSIIHFLKQQVLSKVNIFSVFSSVARGRDGNFPFRHLYFKK